MKKILGKVAALVLGLERETGVSKYSMLNRLQIANLECWSDYSMFPYLGLSFRGEGFKNFSPVALFSLFTYNFCVLHFKNYLFAFLLPFLCGK